MKLNNGQIECTPENTYILRYDNDLLNGVIIDLDDNYAFISAHTDGYEAVEAELAAEGVEVVEVHPDVDLAEAPHAWVVQSLARIVIAAAESLE